MRPGKVIAVTLVAVLIIWSESTAADIVTDKSDGWHTWQIDEVGSVGEMCCFTGQRGSPTKAGCNLDGGRVSFGNDGDCSADTGAVQFYVLVKNGKPLKIRTLSSECPVTTEAAITDHGVVTAGDNIEWFEKVIEDTSLSQSLREEALFGLVQSESNTAFEYLDRLLSGR